MVTLSSVSVFKDGSGVAGSSYSKQIKRPVGYNLREFSYYFQHVERPRRASLVTLNNK